MFCPKCGSPCDETSQFCGNCAAPLSLEPVVFAAPKKGSHLPPVIIMAVMLCIGLVCFFLFPKNRSEAIPEATAARDHFSYSSGTVTFFPEYYTGGESLTVPDTMNNLPVLRIGENGFSGSDMLEEVILPATIIEIDDCAFVGCTSLRGIYIPRTVFRIGNRAFADCTALEAVYIHSSIQTIENDAFTGCTGLQHILFDGTLGQWKTLYTGELPMSVTLHCSDGTYQQEPAAP